MMKVYFKPQRRWWQLWKRDRYLKESEYNFSNGVLTLGKYLKGELIVDYNYEI